MKGLIEVRRVGIDQASLVHAIMLDAFEDYRHEVPPTSALEETEGAVRKEMEGGGRAAIGFIDGVPAASVRYYFQNGLYFHRLAVRRAYRGRGMGHAMLRWLEGEAAVNGQTDLWCKVRANLPSNVALYRRLGYSVEREETETNPLGHPVRLVYMRKSILPAHS